MIALAWTLSLIAIFMLGYHLQTINQKIANLTEAVKNKKDIPPPVEEVKSSFIDPDDPVQQMLEERRKLMSKMNPDE